MTNNENDDLISEDFDHGHSEESIEVDQKYDAPIKKNAIIGSNGSVIDYKDVNPLDVIKKFAEKQGVQLKDPKHNCKHCYGRGYIGRLANQGGAPVPCNCIYPSEVRRQTSQLVVENRALRRNKKYQQEKEDVRKLQMLQQVQLEKKYQAEFSKKVGLPFSDVIGT